MGLIAPDLTGALHGDDLKPAIETILREVNGNISTENVKEINADVANITNINASNITTGKLQSNDSKTYFDLDNNNLVMNDGTNNRVVLNGTSMKVSQPGYDANTANDDQLVMSSDFNMLKIVYTGTSSLVIPSIGNQAIVSIPHGLSYTPGYLAYADYPGGGRSLLPVIEKFIFNEDGTMGIESYIDAYVDSTNMNFIFTNFGNGMGVDETINFKYYLFRETSL